MVYHSLRIITLSLICIPLSLGAVISQRVITAWDARYKKAFDLLQTDPLLNEEELTAAIQDLKDSAPDKSRVYAAQNLQVSLNAHTLLASPSVENIKEVERWISSYTLAGRTQLVTYLKNLVKQTKKSLQTKKVSSVKTPSSEEEIIKIEPAVPIKPTIEEAIRGESASSLSERVRTLQQEIAGIQQTAAILMRHDSEGNQRGWPSDELDQVVTLKKQLETRSGDLSAQDITQAEETVATFERNLAILEGVQNWEKLDNDTYRAFLGLLKTKARMRMPAEFIIQQLQREVEGMLQHQEEE